MCTPCKNKLKPRIGREGSTCHFLHVHFSPRPAARCYGAPLLLHPLYFPFAFLLILLPMGFFSIFLFGSTSFYLSLLESHRNPNSIIISFISFQPTDFPLLFFFFFIPALFLFRVKLFLPVSAH